MRRISAQPRPVGIVLAISGQPGRMKQNADSNYRSLTSLARRNALIKESHLLDSTLSMVKSRSSDRPSGSCREVNVGPRVPRALPSATSRY